MVPKERIVIAVPFYTRVWITKADGSLSSEALSAKRAQQWVQEKNVTLEWQDEIGQYYGSIEDEGVRKQIWMEEAQSMGLKLSHIRAAELGGVAAWKLGQEPEGFWNILNLNQ
nr:glycosyl hydrolase family 18 protein [Oribacterium sp. oral taxon 102]